MLLIRHKQPRHQSILKDTDIVMRIVVQVIICVRFGSVDFYSPPASPEYCEMSEPDYN